MGLRFKVQGLRFKFSQALTSDQNSNFLKDTLFVNFESYSKDKEPVHDFIDECQKPTFNPLTPIALKP